MIPLIADNREAIAELCRQYGIHKLDLFGSAATGEFDPEMSDVDFIVDLGDYEPGVFKRYMEFIDAMESLLGRRIDIITEVQIQNPYFRQAVEEQRISVFATRDRKAIA